MNYDETIVANFTSDQVKGLRAGGRSSASAW